MNSVHKAVLLHEVVAELSCAGFLASPITNANSFQSQNYSPIFLDGTLGGCGHALAMAEAYNKKITIVGLDRNSQVIDQARDILNGQAEKIILACQNFRHLDEVLDKNNIGQVQMMLFDLGLSSDELESSGRGFSFQKDEPLLMTMGDPQSYLFTARDIVNKWSLESLENVIFGYGQERFYHRIARAICQYRQKKAIETSGELSEIIKNAVPVFYRHAKTHPATKTFQAIRITVNDELNSLKEGLEKGYQRLDKNGKMAVISFHSLEDGIVKRFFRQMAKEQEAIITKKPITASREEIQQNPRARSAKLRTLQKVS